MSDLPDGPLGLEVESALPGIGLQNGERGTRRSESTPVMNMDNKILSRCCEKIVDATYEGLILIMEGE